MENVPATPVTNVRTSTPNEENYEFVRKTQPSDAPSKDIIAIVAKQWANTSDEEKAVWKARAEQMKDQWTPLQASTPAMQLQQNPEGLSAAAATAAAMADFDDVVLPEPPQFTASAGDVGDIAGSKKRVKRVAAKSFASV